MLIKPPPKEFTKEMKKQKQDAGGDPGNEIEVTPEMIEAGVDALARARHSGMGDSELVDAVYAVMAAKRESRIGEIIRETVYNIRGVAESLDLCELRVTEHFPGVMGSRGFGRR